MREHACVCVKSRLLHEENRQWAFMTAQIRYFIVKKSRGYFSNIQYASQPPSNVTALSSCTIYDNYCIYLAQSTVICNVSKLV